jgi:putative endonuclease
MSTTSTGRAAEAHAATYLQQHGFIILDRNWRNRWCELDIVAARGNKVHFVEVKYRATTAYGRPDEYINYDKINRLARAAPAWNQAHRHFGEFQIDFVAVTGPLERPQVEYIPNFISA